MEKKRWFLSKRIWTQIITLMIGVYSTIQWGLASGCNNEGLCIHLPQIPEQIMLFLGGAGLYTVATSKSVITK